MKIAYRLVLFLSLLSCSAGGKQKTSLSQEPKSVIPYSFNADSAYHFVQTQVDFGARTPQSEAHQKCLIYLQNQLNLFGAEVKIQKGEAKGMDGKLLPIQNIIASFHQDSKRRILLCTHWDCRQWADQEQEEKKWNTPIPGADDGASGGGVLLEIARQLSLHPAKVGIDLVFFDTEDQGTPRFQEDQWKGNFWCLGSRLWAKEAYKNNYYAMWGILLDMVGGKETKFYQEKVSKRFAEGVQKKLWKAAQDLGYGHLFIHEEGLEVEDDHINVNRFAHIPCIDIIGSNAERRYTFPRYWHTTQDDMSNISKETLKAVGEVLLKVIYDE